jgi:hypothetical protein
MMATRLRIIFQIITKLVARTGCFYDNVLTFSDDGTLKYKLDNGGSTF